jgi:hypothetical protein
MREEREEEGKALTGRREDLDVVLLVVEGRSFSLVAGWGREAEAERGMRERGIARGGEGGRGSSGRDASEEVGRSVWEVCKSVVSSARGEVEEMEGVFVG